MDETLALPSEKAAEIALRTQQLIAYETGATNVVDPLGGSWYIESLTDQMEAAAEKYFDKIDDIGGVIPAIEMGYFQREIAEASSEYQNKVESKQRVIVGVNDFIKENEEIEIPLLEIRKEVEVEQVSMLKSLKDSRDNNAVRQSLNAITEAAKNSENLMPLIITAAKSYASMGEIVDAMKIVFGEWEENVVL